MSAALAVLLASAVALAGWRLDWLSVRGAVAAGVVGTSILLGRGLQGGVMLGVFFVSGSLLTRVSRRESPWQREATGSRARTTRQVLANGSWAALAALLPPAPGWAVFAGALSTAQADTWATEIGSYSRSAPRMVTGGQVVRRGTSGAVTVLGTVGGITGGILMGALTWLFTESILAATAGVVGGIAGMLADSVLGATVQAMYYCPMCRVATENRPHWCGNDPEPVRGLKWLDNDGVNLAATGVGALAALAIWALFRH